MKERMVSTDLLIEAIAAAREDMVKHEGMSPWDAATATGCIIGAITGFMRRRDPTVTDADMVQMCDAVVMFRRER